MPKPAATEKTCKNCLVKFLTSDKRKIFCVQECAKTYWIKNNTDKVRLKSKNWGRRNKQKVKEKNKNWRTGNPEKAKKATKKWRTENRDKVNLGKQRSRKKNRDTVNLNNRRRRCKKLGILHEPYLNTDIFVRDKWKCHICGKNTKTFSYPHPDSPSIDHVIPISKGGADAPYNVACACLVCNLTKSDKLITLF